MADANNSASHPSFLFKHVHMIGCESDYCRPKKSSDEQMTRSGYLGNNCNEECHRLIEHVRFSRRCTLHCGCPLFLLGRLSQFLGTKA